MRITHAMMTNTTLMHINRNMRNLDAIVRQMETTKRISMPSDDPIRAARALKFRTASVENEQFQRNVNNGLAWMNVTESAFNNINQELLRQIRELAVQGANDTLNLDNKTAIVHQMRSLFDEIGNQVNQTFAGRYLFSGLRTDEPPIFGQDNNRSFVITQHFSLNDIVRASSFQRLPNAQAGGLVEPVVHDISVLRLAYQSIDTPALALPLNTTIIDNPAGISIPGFNVRKISIENPNAYLPPAAPGAGGLPVLHLIAETGELVMHNDIANSFPREGVSVTYQKTGFRQGDINPAVYFTAREIDPRTLATPPILPTTPVASRIYSVTQYFSRAAGTPVGPIGAPTAFTFTLQFPPHTEVPMPAGLAPVLPPGATIAGNVVTIPANLFNTESNISVTYSVAVPNAAAANALMMNTAIQGAELVRALGPTGVPVPTDLADFNRTFNMNNQAMEMEFARNTFVQINSLAKDLLTDHMFADFRRLFEFTDAIYISDVETLRTHFTTLYPNMSPDEINNAIDEQLSREQGLARSALYTKFNNLLRQVDGHADNAMREQTQLGARMTRLHLLQARLESDAVSLEELTSKNEDTDMIRALVIRESLLAAFMGSLHANANVIQMTLANFIR